MTSIRVHKTQVDRHAEYWRPLTHNKEIHGKNVGKSDRKKPKKVTKEERKKAEINE